MSACLEPYLLTGSGPAPFVETDAEGYAIEASLTENDPNLSVPPGQIQEATAASLEGAADAVKNPDNLTDLQDQASFRPRLPDGSADTDRHYVSGPVFGLKTAGGGALVFYGLTARLSLAPPPGGTFELGVPATTHPARQGGGHGRRSLLGRAPPAPAGTPPRPSSEMPWQVKPSAAQGGYLRVGRMPGAAEPPPRSRAPPASQVCACLRDHRRSGGSRPGSRR